MAYPYWQRLQAIAHGHILHSRRQKVIQQLQEIPKELYQNSV